MNAWANHLERVCLGGGACVAIAGACMAAWYAPIEASMGLVQKIFYLHLPAAMCMFGACAGVCAANVAYLWRRRERWDRVGLVLAEAAVLLSVIVLATGMVWGRVAWGQWWTWSPRLTFSLILALLYAAYLVLHRSIDGTARRDVICAVYGIVAFTDVPLVYLSVKLLPDIHPSSVELDERMRVTVLACLAAGVMLTTGLVMRRIRGSRVSSMNR